MTWDVYSADSQSSHPEVPWKRGKCAELAVWLCRIMKKMTQKSAQKPKGKKERENSTFKEVWLSTGASLDIFTLNTWGFSFLHQANLQK